MQKIWTTGWLMLVIFNGAHADEADHVASKAAAFVPELQLEAVEALRDSGLYEAEINGQIVYLTADGKYLIEGKVFSLETLEDLTAARTLRVTRNLLAQIDPQSLIEFAPPSPDYVLTVFTDIDCGYCRIMHREMQAYNDLGIAIRYAAAPRELGGSASHEKAVNVWCAADRHQAMTDAKADKVVESPVCRHPVDDHQQLSIRLGVRGTPALFLENGQLLPGYLPPKRLREVLDEWSAIDSTQ